MRVDDTWSCRIPDVDFNKPGDSLGRGSVRFQVMVKVSLQESQSPKLEKPPRGRIDFMFLLTFE